MELNRVDSIKWNLSNLWENQEINRGWDTYKPDGRRIWRVWGGGGFDRLFTTPEVEAFIVGLRVSLPN